MKETVHYLISACISALLLIWCFVHFKIRVPSYSTRLQCHRSGRVIWLKRISRIILA